MQKKLALAAEREKQRIIDNMVETILRSRGLDPATEPFIGHVVREYLRNMPVKTPAIN